MFGSTAGLVCLVLLRFPASSSSSDQCSLAISRSSVENSWQTSSFLGVVRHCFANSSSKDVGKPSFLHTDGGMAHSDAGYIWFVVQLKNPVYFTGITIQNRESKDGESAEDLSSRASDIEVWSSSSEQLHFGTNYCATRGISTQFKRAGLNWSQCGSTPALKAIRSGAKLSVSCTQLHKARFILLRKKIDSSQSEDRQYMGFNNMWISLISVQINISNESPMNGSNVTVNCATACNADGRRIRVCSPDGLCYGGFQMIIALIRPSDSGEYSCKIGDIVVSNASVSVQYPPSWIEITPQRAISCGHAIPVHATFQVSSSSAEPGPEHWCTVVDSAGGRREMRQQPQGQQAGDRIDTLWLCANCSSAAGLHVNCSASNRFGTSTAHWRCEQPATIFIELGKSTERRRGLEVEFSVTSTDASPQPEHRCKASVWHNASIAMELSVHHVDSRDVRSRLGALQTLWSTMVPQQWTTNAQLVVDCTASHRFAWSKSQSAFLTLSSQQQQQTISFVPFLGFCGGFVFIVLIVVGASILCCCKVRRMQIALTQLVPAVVSNTAYLSQPSQTREENEESEHEYDILEKVSDNPTYTCLRKIEPLEVNA